MMSLTSYRRSILPLILTIALASASGALGQGKPKQDLRAYELSRLLLKSKVTRDFNQRDLGKTSDDLKQVLGALENSFRTSGPSPKDLLRKAYEFIDEEVGHHEAVVTSGSILKAWETASGKGMFNDARQFTGTITKGRDYKKKAIFEYIIPADKMPRFSTHFANIRLTIPSMARKEGAALTSREIAFVPRLRTVLTEMDQREDLAEVGRKEKFNGVGQTADEAQKRWDQEVKEAGDAMNHLPNIQLSGTQSGSPTRMTKDRWKVTIDVGNISRYPTEVEVQWWLFGITEEKRDHYIMTKGTEKLQLRQNMDVQFDLYTSPAKSYKNQADDNDELTKKERKLSKVVFRGYAVKVVHKKGVAAATASDQRLLSYVNELAEEGEEDDGRDVKRVKDFSKRASADSGYKIAE